MTLATTTVPDVVESRTVEQNPVLTYLASVSANSRPTLIHSLAGALGVLSNTDAPTGVDAKLRWIAPFAWHRLTHAHVAFLRSELADRCAARTANRCLAAVRGVLKSAWRCGLMSHEEMARASDVPSVKVNTLPAGRHVNTGELRALFAACADGTAAGVRDAAILSLAYGMRRAEIASIDYAAVDLDAGKITVTGKGNKQRVVYVANGGLQALRDWASIRGEHPGAFLHPIRRGGRVIVRDRGMTSQSVYGRIERRRRQAGVPPLTPHDFRRSFISDALDAGVDLIALQRLVGHADPATTSRYDRRGERACQAGASLLHLPYTGR